MGRRRRSSSRTSPGGEGGGRGKKEGSYLKAAGAADMPLYFYFSVWKGIFDCLRVYAHV